MRPLPILRTSEGANMTYDQLVPVSWACGIQRNAFIELSRGSWTVEERQIPGPHEDILT